jgi:hypothetical protein
MTSLREKLIKTGAKVVSHGRYVTFHMWTSGNRGTIDCSASPRDYPRFIHGPPLERKAKM